MMLLNRNQSRQQPDRVGVLVSGGLDSCILLKHLLELGYRVKPFYIRSGLFWETAERQALKRYLNAVANWRLEALSLFDLPLTDVYADHWSITGQNVPEAGTPDEAVYLPGRNLLLTIKAALWCQLHDIDELALATLRSNPFEDASSQLLDRFGEVLSEVSSRPIRLVRPFGDLDKRQVMEIGRDFPLDLTFSCMAPCKGEHCGRCNKCDERQAAFRLIDSPDPTTYASDTCSPSPRSSGHHTSQHAGDKLFAKGTRDAHRLRQSSLSGCHNNQD